MVDFTLRAPGFFTLDTHYTLFSTVVYTLVIVKPQSIKKSATNFYAIKTELLTSDNSNDINVALVHIFRNLRGQ